MPKPNAPGFQSFFDEPILNSPYKYPGRHWELDGSGQPTGRIVPSRRTAEFITPIPKPKKHVAGAKQEKFQFQNSVGPSTDSQEYDLTLVINRLRELLTRWRALEDSNAWLVTPETARLLRHWRHHRFSHWRPFFCQIEAVEAAIWLTEVAPRAGKDGQWFLHYLGTANEGANPGLSRIALKMATGAGKTTVMAMIIAWQTINAVRHPGSKHFTRGFLVVTPGITIRDRLRVLQPNDPDSYYQTRELVPTDMLRDLEKARIVITNYHALKRRETLSLAKGTRSLLQGRGGPSIATTETDGQMLQRVMPELMNIKNILAINDEGHHCYREKPDTEEEAVTGDERAEAEKNREAARVWISGLEIVKNHIGLQRIFDLSATPFFLQGSGYAEGTLFPWTMSDFSLMDAIECGIVKLPRVPISDNVTSDEMPKLRTLWEHIGKSMPKTGLKKLTTLDPLGLPTLLKTALDALYGHYEKTFTLWNQAGIDVPPCFIIVCNNTATSKLVYDYVSGFKLDREDGTTAFHNGRFEFFRNFASDGTPIPRPRTLLIDSEQLESGDALDDNFRKLASDEIERFRREIVLRTGDRERAANLTDQDLLREVMNTVGRRDRLGESVRCVVSVSMLTEGWDASTVTHVLGIRAFGTQLLCEQVVGRALRRQSYDLNENGLFNVEYADVLGIPFNFTAKPVVAGLRPPRKTIHVHAVSPERDACEIVFPRVEGYRVELPEDNLTARFSNDSTLTLTPELTGPSSTTNSGIIGAAIDLDLSCHENVRRQTLLFSLTRHLIETQFRDGSGDPKIHLFGQLKAIAGTWLDKYLVCKGGTYPAQLMYRELADMACERIRQAIDASVGGSKRVRVVLDPYNATDSTRHVSFNTSKELRWETRADRCHVNWVIADSEWERTFCHVVELQPKVRAYVKNHGLGFEVPYLFKGAVRRYLADFIVLVDDGHGDDDLLRLVVEVKGFRGEDAKVKKATMETYWVPGVNALGTYGRWDFVELTDVWEMKKDLEAKIGEHVAAMIQRATAKKVVG